MERESCFSLSLSAMTPRKGLANPMADSTRIEGAPLTTTLSPKLSRLYSLHGSSDRANGEGGMGRSISQNQRSNSYSNLSIGSSNKSPYDLNRTTSSSYMNRSKLNLSQLDPRTYANVNSTGLASRIAKYHESGGGGGRLQRSISVNNLAIPLARPRRSIASSVTYSPSVPKLSATRIAPPERSFYSGNTLSSLLRSNSVVGAVHKLGDQQQGQEQLSRENRPILHPPPTQQEIEPTRSVLEELKEISRKRINSGEPHESPHEFAKKRMAEFADPVHSHGHQAAPGTTSHQLTASFKRQREQPLPLTVAVPLRQHHNAAPSPTGMHHHQHLQPNGTPKLGTPPQISPEQQAAKRRNCSFSNDIASSLSSSRRQTHKRKLYDTAKINQRQLIAGHELSSVGANCSSSSENSPSEQASKIQRKVEMDSVGKTLSMPVTTTTAVVAVPPPRMHSAPTQVDSVSAPKPKLTLFNAQQKTQSTYQEQEQSLDLNSPEVDACEYAGIQFVKPKQQSSNGVGIGKNPSIERMQKTKLAIMLSGLRGEMYLGETEAEDDVDAHKLSSPIKPIVASTTTTSTTTTIATTTTAVTAIKTCESILPKPKVDLKLQSNSSSSSSIAQVKPSTMFGNQVKTLTSETLTTAATPTAAANPSTAATVTMPAATTIAAATTATATTVATSLTTTTTPFTFGDAIKGAATNMGQPKNDSPLKSETKTIAAVNPILSFGAPKATAASPPAAAAAIPPSSVPTTIAKLQFGAGGGSTSVSSMFSFGNNAAQTTTSSTLTTNQTTTTTASTAFTFGGGISTTTTTTSGEAATTTTAAATPTPAVTTFGQLNKANTSSQGFGGFSFGGNAAAASAAPASSAPALGAFGNPSNSFANSFKQPEATASAASTTTSASTTLATPAFGSQPSTSSISFANPNPPSQESGKPFSFSATPSKAAAVVEPTTTTTNLFSFGASNETSKPAEPAPSTTNMFGQNIFGQKPAEAETSATTPFAFGGAVKAAVPPATTAAAPSTPFAFGGGAAPKPLPAAPEASSPFTFAGLKPAAGPTTTPAATEKSTPFAFGGAKPAASSSNLFSFSGPSAAATQGQAPAATLTGGAASSGSNNAFNFNANSVQKPASLFGSPKPVATSTAAAPSLATTKPFSFGGGATAQQQQQGNPEPAAPAPGAFSFAASINKANGETNGGSNIFGAPTGVVKPSFGFGDTTTTAGTPAPAQAPTSFGGFGGAAANNQNKPFNFGGNATAAVAPAAAAPPLGGNLFANAVAAAQFGAPGASNNMAPAKPFNFGGTQSPSQNVFGTPAPTASSAPKPGAGAFHFGAAAPSTPAMPVAPQQINANSMFAPPPGGPDRPIRRATRRLQK